MQTGKTPRRQDPKTPRPEDAKTPRPEDGANLIRDSLESAKAIGRAGILRQDLNHYSGLNTDIAIAIRPLLTKPSSALGLDFGSFEIIESLYNVAVCNPVQIQAVSALSIRLA